MLLRRSQTKEGQMAKSTKSVDLEFSQEKETKGTVRYSEDSDEPKVGKLYIKKDAAKELGNPKNLNVTIAAA
jgi:hypothetical protein